MPKALEELLEAGFPRSWLPIAKHAPSQRDGKGYDFRTGSKRRERVRQELSSLGLSPVKTNIVDPQLLPTNR
jgi:hypothetical protein